MMEKKEIGFGIIGHGFMGHEHEKMLLDFPGIKLVGITDRDPQQLEDVAEGVKRYKSAAELVQDPDIDVVIIAANNNQHFQLVETAARAHKDIICEKPAAMTVEEYDKMQAIVKECGVKFTVHQQRRYDPDFRRIKAVYDEQKLGTPYVLKNQLYGFNGNMHDWHIYPAEGGGMLYDWGVHLIDQVLWMMAGHKVKSVFATIRNVINKEVDDYFNIQLRFDNGLMAEIELGTYYLKDAENWFERHWFLGGNTGSAYVDGFFPQGKIVRTAELLQNVSGKRTMTAAGPTRSFGPPREGLIQTEELPRVHTEHRDYFRNYVKAWHGEGEFLVKSEEVRRVLDLMETARRSAKEGCSIEFEE